MKQDSNKPSKKYSSKKVTPVSELKEPAIAYITKPINGAVAILGMQGNAQFKAIKNDNDFIDLIREGIPKEAMNNLMLHTGITVAEMSDIIHVSDRTLRRYNDSDRLPQEQSERIIELARLYSRGSEVFDGLEYFNEWMNTSLMPLGNKKPKEFLDTSLGIELLMKELGRIEHGIFA